MDPPIVQVGSLRHRSPLHRPLGHLKARKNPLRGPEARSARALYAARSAQRAPRARSAQRALPKIGNLESPFTLGLDTANLSRRQNTRQTDVTPPCPSNTGSSSTTPYTRTLRADAPTALLAAHTVSKAHALRTRRTRSRAATMHGLRLPTHESRARCERKPARQKSTPVAVLPRQALPVEPEAP